MAFDEADGKVEEIFCMIEKDKSEEIHRANRLTSPSDYINSITESVDTMNLSLFTSLVTPNTLSYTLLYEYDDLPLLEYIFNYHKRVTNTCNKRCYLKMALHLTNLLGKRESKPFYDALGHTKEEVERICQEE